MAHIRVAVARSLSPRGISPKGGVVPQSPVPTPAPDTAEQSIGIAAALTHEVDAMAELTLADQQRRRIAVRCGGPSACGSWVEVARNGPPGWLSKN